ncbi:AsnC family transcriptional regulator [Nitratireductor indicus C115]|uniref:AsnC family transcriptional regulator n=2 Tax=Nitratireductor indicus TaxID=721133 RepID=K2NUA0_9HYPH|nr:AsnC family transcriptional regulator [Nitratireductor indicus C115]SFQ71876.1 DNA-binding transcriptional regulator, Lrp family [Nitratireductor indicus]
MVPECLDWDYYSVEFTGNRRFFEKMDQIELDERDRRLLELLQADCRISNADLAERVGMSSSACWRRVKALEEAGVIERYGAILRPSRLGLSFQAIVHVQLARHDPDAIAVFIRSVAARREVQDCYATTGQADYHLRVVCTDIDAYNHFLEDFLFRLPAVRGAQTNVVLREIKRSVVLEL